ncbi:MAG: hypothetical protein HUK08_08825 [Bacteroidaceae bacterium]|nr:hypothetical protein [Bacteroidaceae bacterium]
MLSEKIQSLKKKIIDSRSPFLSELTNIEENFQRMTDFYAQGNIDPQLDAVYAELENSLEKLENKMKLYGLCAGNPFYQKMVADALNDGLNIPSLRAQLENFVVDVTMLELEADDTQRIQKQKEIYSRQHEYRKLMFAKLFIMPELNTENADALEATILSNSIDTIDAQIMVTAITLACINIFDKRKAELLYNIYRKAQNMTLQQKALTGFVLCANRKTGSFNLKQYPLPPTLLATIQRQLIYTLDSPRVERIMQDEIMPDVIKNSEFDFQNNRIVRKQHDKLDEILNPNKEEESMEAMEATMKRMKNLQEQGADLFFSGFRYVKQHPFFSTILNWFCPFYSEHPQLPEISNPDDATIIMSMADKTPFCESDKYSFIISMQKAIGTLPEDMKKMIKDGHAQLEIVGNTGPFERNATYIRRIYMQDIFRFFKLCPYARYLFNPLDPMSRSLFVKAFLETNSPEYEETAINVCKTLRKVGQTEEHNALLRSWQPQTQEGRIFKAYSTAGIDGEEANAIGLLKDILATDEHNVQALYGITKACFAKPELYREFAAYKDSAINALLALFFKNENDNSVLHTLVKAYIMTGNNEKAANYAKQILEKGSADNFIYNFLGISHILADKVKRGLSLLRKSKDTPAQIFASAASYNLPLSPAQKDLLTSILTKSE